MAADLQAELDTLPASNGVSNAEPISNRSAERLIIDSLDTDEERETASSRLERWRFVNRERYNAYMREYMRKRRSGNT